MTDKMMLTLQDLHVLAATAERNGTIGNFAEVALQWAGEAQREIERLRADSARLDWLMRHVSGQEFRRIGIEYSAGCSRHNIDAAMSDDNEPVQKKPSGDEP